MDNPDNYKYFVEAISKRNAEVAKDIEKTVWHPTGRPDVDKACTYYRDLVVTENIPSDNKGLSDYIQKVVGQRLEFGPNS